MLPGRPRPLDDENFLSWLSRLAISNVCDPTHFTQLILPGFDVWGGCINGDSSYQPEVILSNLTNISTQVILNTYSSVFAKKHFMEISQSIGRYYFLSGNYEGRKFKSNWMQFCPLCLKNDAIPYYRNIWRISFLPICIKHKCLLYDRCPECFSPINFHQIPYSSSNISVCYKCNFFFSNCKIDCCKNDKNLMSYASIISEGIDSGWVSINSKPIFMPLFIYGVWLLLKPFYRKKTQRKVREYFNIHKLDEPQSIQSFTHLTSIERSHLLSAIGSLLNNWPNSFITICKKLELNRVSFYVNETNIPFWLFSILNLHIKKQPYWVNDCEFLAAASYLKKHRFEVSYANVAEAVGLDRSCQRTENRSNIINQFKIDISKYNTFHW